MDDAVRTLQPGGTVKPTRRSTVTQAAARTLEAQMAARYELRDPFAEVTYRTRTLDEMVAKADQLGAVRFSAIDEQGQRTPVVKVRGEWQHTRNERSEAPRTADVIPIASSAPTSSALQGMESDGERAAAVARLQIALNERYVIKRAAVALGGQPVAGHTEYRYRGDTSRIAFTETAFRLSTDTNSPSVARSMVDVAETRNWQSLRISGHDDFKRLVWLEASMRGVKTIGYEPVPGDLELFRQQREARQINRIEGSPATPAAKMSSRGSGTRKAVLAALEAVLVAQKVAEPRREAIMAAAAEQLTRRIAHGEVHKVRVYDRSAPSHRTLTPAVPEPKRDREASHSR